MKSPEIVVGERWRDDVRYLQEIRLYRPSGTALNPVDLRDIVDLIVDGRNLTAEIEEESFFGLLFDLVNATNELLTGSAKAIIEFPTAPYELVLVADGDRVLLSLYSIDHELKVVAHNATLPTKAWITCVIRAAEDILSELLDIDDRFGTDVFIRSFSRAVAQLHRRKSDLVPSADRQTAEIAGATSSQSGLTLHYELYPDQDLLGFGGENPFDLHVLLVRGQLQVDWLEQITTISSPYPVLGVMTLLRRARELLNLVEASRGDFSCVDELPHLTLRVRAKGRSWCVGWGRNAIDAEMDSRETLETILSLCELILQDLHALNPKLQMNQRFEDMMTEVNDLRSWFEELAQTNTYFETPEEFLKENAGIRPLSVESSEPTFSWPFSSVRALYPRHAWSFGGDTIHFQGVSVLPERILVPTSRSLIALDAGTGAPVWQADDRGGSLLASYAQTGNFVVLANEVGELWLVDLMNGEDLGVLRGGETGGQLLLDAAFYPETQRLVVADLNGVLRGVSLENSGVDWENDSGHGFFVGVAFDGPLVCTLSSPGFIQAFHPVTGQRLWKVRLGGIADAGPIVHEGRIYAFTHDPVTHALCLHALFPFTGRTAWMHRFDGSLAGHPNFAGERLVVPVEKSGRVTLEGVSLETQTVRSQWSIEISTAGIDRPTRVAMASIEGKSYGIVKSDRGEVTCFELLGGEIRWRQRLEGESGLLFRNIDLVVVRDSVFTMGESLEIRSVDDGRVLHKLDDVVENVEYIHALNSLEILVGGIGRGSEGDELLCLTLSHFLALVPQT